MLHCPVCGYRLKPETRGPAGGSGPVPTDQHRIPTWLWISGVALLFVLLLAGIAGLGMLAFRQGLEARTQRLTEIARSHYERGLELAETGNLELALAELDEAARLAPAFPAAAEKAREIRQQLSAPTIPTALPQLETADALYQSAEAADAAGNPDEAVRWLQELRDLYPGYRQADVANLLYSVAYRHGEQLVAEDRLEDAIRRFDDALTARPDDPSALAQKRLAGLYLTALRTGGQAGWDTIVANWEAVYRMEAGYKDVAERLAQAYAGQGDARANQKLWCEAQASYQRGADISPAPSILAKLDDARARCAEPSTPVAAQTAGPRRQYVGQIAGTLDIPTNRIHIRGRVVDRRGRPVAGTGVRISAFNWSAVATTDGDGNFSFDGLSNPAVYTLVLIGLSSQPLEVPTEWGKQHMVNFVEQR
jgi:tetratricopeptide (TPR) repeat protein